MRPLFREMLSEKYRVVGYDLKKDLERIEAYLEEGAGNSATGQMGLF